MQLRIRKSEIIIAFIIFIVMILTFPLLSWAIEIEQKTENINEETEELDKIMEKADEIEDEETISEIEDEEEWEIVIIDEPIPGAIPTLSQIESSDPLEEITPAAIILPQTGELNSIPLSSLGAIMVCLGVYINRKKMNKFQS